METERAVRSVMMCRITVGVILVLCMGLTGWADGLVYNVPPEESQGMIYAAASESLQLGFDPDDYAFLVYDCGTDSHLQSSMQAFGISNFTLRTPASSVTAYDLQTHDILIVGWNTGSSGTTGLNPQILQDGITGRVFLTGHDLDYHTINGPLAAKTLFSRAIQYVLEGGGTGMIALGDLGSLFSWLPETWEINGVNNSGETIYAFTDEAISSGLYDGLEPDSENPDIRMSRWGTSYHNSFSSWGSDFVSFELGNSSQNQHVVTIARPNMHGLRVIKTDNRDPEECVWPENEITYTLDYSRMLYSTTDLENVILVDILPKGVTFLFEISDANEPDIDPNNIWQYINDPNFTWPQPAGTAGVYNPITHTITWQLGEIAPGDSGSVSFVVQVNEKSEPSGNLINIAELRDDSGTLARVRIETPVCCWTNGRIYVDWDATGSNAGTSWENAYTDLQSALARAARGCGGEEIWVAAGLYSPGISPTDTFAISEGVSVYGGFAGRETSLEQRNLNTYPSVLSGYISDTLRNITIVAMGNDSLLDGFTVGDAANPGDGIFGQDVDFSVSNCLIENNQRHGVRSLNSNVSVKWCAINNNGFDGIYHDGENVKTLIVENSRILKNGQNGVYARLSTPQIYNSQINFNGTEVRDEEGNIVATDTYGLYLFYPRAGSVVQNNTLVYNLNQGIRVVDPNTPIEIQNCVLWGNKLYDGQDQLTGNVVAFYSCVYDPNNPNQTTPDLIWNNISCYPEFAYDGDPNATVFRLLPGSPCIDRGDPSLTYDGQVDIDNELRWMGDTADMGADEINPDCGDVYNPWDLNADGLVNLVEFAKLSRVWLAHDPNDPAIIDPNHLDHAYYTDPNSPGYITPAQLAAWYPDGHRFNVAAFGDSEYAIDLADLMVFLEDVPWLWVACWRTDIWQQQAMAMMFMQPDTGEFESIAMRSSSAAEETKTAETVSPEVELATILRLLDQIDVFIDADGDDAEAWTELKYLLEYTLSETEDRINQSEMF